MEKVRLCVTDALCPAVLLGGYLAPRCKVGELVDDAGDWLIRGREGKLTSEKRPLEAPRFGSSGGHS
jgi:hypothetical protein